MTLGLFRRLVSVYFLSLTLFCAGLPCSYANTTPSAAAATATAQPEAAPSEGTTEVEFGSTSIFSRALQGGVTVFLCLLILVGMSVTTWAVVISKFLYLKKVTEAGDGFIKSFWDSRSLNDLNGKLADFPYSPIREVFRSGYAELVRANQLRDQAIMPELAINAALDNLNRAIGKAKILEKRRLEKYMPVLAISASACPFIGLFGTVWGIMGSFEGIAKTGSASLAAVAPGISEALIATAFGLAAAIPAVVGYNIFAAKMREMMITIDGFTADFMNIVERYLVTDKARGGAASATSPQPPIG